MNRIPETDFLYWLYNKIEVIKDRNEIKNIKEARNTINEIKNKLIYIPECYRIHFE